MKVPIGQIRPNPFQVRKHIDRAAIEALADEIKALGFWGGLRARKQGDHYELCFGHRRLEALKLLKVKEVELDLAKFSDDEMAIQALVENLQREGLRDIEKAEGIQRLIDRFVQDGDRRPRARVAALMGIGEVRIGELLGLLELTRPLQKLVERGEIAGKTAMQARRLGGNDMVETAAKHKLPLHTISGMITELAAIEEPQIREKVKRAVISGRVRDPESVREHERKVRRQEAERTGEKAPPDLRIVIRQWSRTMEEWTKQLDAVLPYMDYIDADKELAARFKAATRALIDKLQRFL